MTCLYLFSSNETAPTKEVVECFDPAKSFQATVVGSGTCAIEAANSSDAAAWLPISEIDLTGSSPQTGGLLLAYKGTVHIRQ
jgi:hypothetical protein